MYAAEYMREHNNPSLLYHNYNHTASVVRACDIISLNMGLGKQDRMTLHLAAWFHDLGYFTNPQEHEALGADMAEAYFRKKGLDEDRIEEIRNCILATRMPQQPTTLMEQIICDADLISLGNRDEEYLSSLLREEMLEIKHQEFTEEEWLKFNLSFLRNHFYFTSFARNEFDKQKRKNIELLEEKLETLKHPNHKKEETFSINPKEISEKEIKLERGVETFYKITAGNQMKLNDTADKKANTIISINTLIISIVISLMAPKLHNNPQLVVPVLMLIVSSVIAIVLAVLATKPKIISNKPTKSENKDDVTNVMFFGHFYQMNVTDYQKKVRDLLYQRTSLYDEISKDIYYHGQVLAKKFRLIGIGYIVFIIGLIISVVTFSMVFILTTPK